MLSELEGIVRLVEGVDVELLDGDVGRREWLAHRLEKGLVPLEVMDRLLQTFGKAIGADFLALESDDFSSMLVDSASWPLKGEATRSAPSRFSGPQAP